MFYKTFAKTARARTEQQKQIERKAFKCLPHNRRQVKFIFLTNNMKFKGTWPNPRSSLGSKEIEIVKCVRETRETLSKSFKGGAWQDLELFRFRDG